MRQIGVGGTDGSFLLGVSKDSETVPGTGLLVAAAAGEMTATPGTERVTSPMAASPTAASPPAVPLLTSSSDDLSSDDEDVLSTYDGRGFDPAPSRLLLLDEDSIAMIVVSYLICLFAY